MHDPDPKRRTGRTTRMLITALQRFMCDKPPKMFILAHDIGWSIQLLHKFAHLLKVLGVPFRHNTSKGGIIVDDREVLFCTRQSKEYEFRGQEWNGVPIFEDNYLGR